MDISKTINENKLLIASLLSFLVTGMFSQGFMHPDEHYQILELLNMKFESPYQDLSILNWDFKYKMRSWIQPFMYYITLFSLKTINPFMLSMLIRLINGLIGFYSILIFIKMIFPGKWKKVLFFVSYTWFIPFLMVRTSSESLATSLFIFGYYLCRKNKFYKAALLFGVTFLVRFQMAVLIAPLMIFSLYYKKISLRKFVGMLVIIIIAQIFGVAIDFWGYGTWTWSAYNYLYYNLIEGLSKDFGTEPFYYYFLVPAIKGIPLISIPIIVNYIKNSWRSTDLVLPLSFLIFIIINSLISHKEIRFLTPIYILMSIYAVSEMLNSKFWDKYKFLYFGLSIIVMIKTSLTPAHSRIGLYNEVYNKEISTIYTIKNRDFFKFSMPFYMRREIKVLPENMVNDLSEYLLLTTNHNEKLIVKKRSNCDQIYSQYPVWIKYINITDWLSRSSYFTMWKCTNNNT
jgi:phosphatidylinositol glycan class B